MMMREGGTTRPSGRSRVPFDPTSVSMCSGLIPTADDMNAADPEFGRLKYDLLPSVHCDAGDRKVRQWFDPAMTEAAVATGTQPVFGASERR